MGSYPNSASPYGALDMAGNVSEWVADYYDWAYYSSSPSANPTGPGAGTQHGYRGGAWLDVASRLRTSARGGKETGARFGHLGFRCAYGP